MRALPEREFWQRQKNPQQGFSAGEFPAPE
jgi:hypothetical protein